MLGVCCCLTFIWFVIITRLLGLLVDLWGLFTVCLVIGCWFDVLFTLVGNDCYYVMLLVGCFGCEGF